MKIKNILTDYYKIPLPTVMTDSTHGVMRFFELITVRVQDNNGNEGLGYTYTVGAGGNAIRNLIETDIKPILINENCELIENLWKKCGGIYIMLVEEVFQF
jgi:L-alanine-DL-glutamate epimerase-like enolase superfamily enzyme